MISYSQLKRKQVLGNNNRLINFILPYNKRRDYPLVDDKIKTAKLLRQHSIPHPDSLGIINSISDTRTLHAQLETLNTFVVKPARGSTGNGIIIVEDIKWSQKKDETTLITTRREQLKYNEFIYYLSMILSGTFSLSGQKDRVLIQEKLNIHPILDPISYKGIPDVRIIVFNGFPVMSMLRLPTKKSRGRGNLHQGAVGCGIDLKSGKITSAIYEDQITAYHPDFSQIELNNVLMPHWSQVLDIATQCSKLTDINYLGVDIVIDPERGPLVLEINARPGLSIQLANQKGLLTPLNIIKNLKSANMSLDDKISFARANF